MFVIAPFNDQKNEITLFFRSICEEGRPFYLYGEVQNRFEAYLERFDGIDPELEVMIRMIQEAAVSGPLVYLALRPDIAEWVYLLCDTDNAHFEVVSVRTYLDVKEDLVENDRSKAWRFRLDVEPFNRDFPKIKDYEQIGNGIEYLNRNLMNYFSEENGAMLVEFLSLHQYNGMQLMLNPRIQSIGGLRKALNAAMRLLKTHNAKTPYAEIAMPLQEFGFEPGWGNNVARIRHTMNLLKNILELPNPTELEEFLALIPMIFKVAILSPHGFFGQSKVLGFPDTGGQVVYILDQVRALEHEMRRRLHEQGVDVEPEIVVLTRQIPEARGTTCDQRTERIRGTQNALILRVPFRGVNGEVIPHWISRFHIWPYLEQYTLDAERELLAQMRGRPDLIIGNYSDGNLVATLMAKRLKVTQCTIAHALEKTKYLYSDLYWMHNEEEYHFSAQFTADLIAMNSADFIIASTYQEIAGTEESIGQYESYQTFTMPGLYQVENGIEVTDPKFNIISPGANAEIFFPYTEEAKRSHALQEEIESLIFGEPTEVSRGKLEDTEKPIIFSIARLDRVKNLTSLVEWYGGNETLRKQANLFIIAGHVMYEKSSDDEEREQIVQMHALFDRYGLDGQVRWVGVQLEKQLTGELYRFIADRQGIFVQPALFEAFGLTVIEAMASGLPVFATCYGGPLEIIEDGVSGFHIDPTNAAQSTETMTRFFARCAQEKSYWQGISQNAVARVAEKYNWPHYADRLMTLARVYGFWQHVTNKNRAISRRYLEMFYALMYRPMVRRMHRPEFNQ